MNGNSGDNPQIPLWGNTTTPPPPQLIMQFDIYELLNSNEREILNEIVLEACARKGYDPNDVDYDIQGTIVTIM